ncbi:ADA20 protein, partial [Syrrhaptes paradoxus]|nr:ADA20 protein [Syrrhaptes paradoxus]
RGVGQQQAAVMGARLGLLVLLGLAGCPAASRNLPGERRVTATWVTVPRQLSPRADTNPLATVSYWLQVAGRPWVLHLRRRQGLVSSPFTLVTYSKDGARWEEHPFVQDHCFYQGEVQGSPNSLVALSTCGRGLRGVLWVEDGTYEIEPVPDDPAFRHILYRMEEANNSMGPTCGLTPEELEHQKAVLPWFKAPQVEEEEEERVEEWWTHVRYVKIVVVVDNVRFVKSGRNESEVLRQVMEVINAGDSLYEQLSVRLFLVGLEIWTKSNLINVTSTINKVLHDFNKWRKSDLSPRIRHDVSQLLAFQSFGKSLGLAYVGSICDNQWSSAVGSFTDRKLSSFITTFVHELGHTLGMNHDRPGCHCKRKKCIMYESDADTDAFSDCSYKDYFDMLVRGAGCIRQPPAPGTYYTMKHEYCGNEIVEHGEQCDCGSVCRRDPCCNPNCTFTANSVCASGKCCKRCRVLPAGTLCRASTGNCDLPEYCNGTSSWCPPDLYTQDGTPCEDGAYCYRGKCSSHTKQCQHLFGRQARAASLDCFIAVNTRGDRFGNCGIRDNIHFIKCSIKNVLCGRIQCENIKKLPFLQNHVTVIQTPVGDKKCWGLDYHVGIPIADVGAVEDGTPCGTDMLCINRTCTSVSVLKYDCNMTKCRDRGVCNNRKNCHCRYGWAPPYCERAGFGGSIDSGPPSVREICERAKIGIILFTLLFLCILGGAVTVHYKQEIMEWLRRKKAQF